MRRLKLWSIAACMLAAAGVARETRADFIVGQPIVIQDTAKAVTLRFVSSDSAWDSVLWITAQTARDHQETPLFFNHESMFGDEYVLGLYEPGQRIDFIYDIITGQTNSFRSDDPVGILQFGYEELDAETIRIRMEDVQVPGGDRDYNDLVIDMRMVVVPGPAGASVVGVAGLLVVGRRRR